MRASITARTRIHNRRARRPQFPVAWNRIPASGIALARLIDRFDRRHYGADDTDTWVDTEAVLFCFRGHPGYADLWAAIVAGDMSASLPPTLLRSVALALRWTVGSEVRRHRSQLRGDPHLTRRFVRLLRGM